MPLNKIKKLIKKVLKKDKVSTNKNEFVRNNLKCVVGINNNNKYIKIVGYTGNKEKISIPSKIAGRPVEVIGKGAFSGNTKIKHFVMPKTIRVLGAEAFKDCTALESIEISSELQVINNSCFENCTELKTVVLPYELKSVGKKAFKNCVKLNVMYHFVKTGLGAKATLSRKLTEEKLPSGMLEIKESAFENCESIESVYLPYKIEHISDNAFRGCKNLKEVLLHSKLKSIGSNTFTGCPMLKSVKLPLKIEKIDSNSFDKACEIQYYDGINSSVLDTLASYKSKLLDSDNTKLDSKMIPGKTTGCFYNEEELEKTIEAYELRTPITETIERTAKTDEIICSRYSLVDDKYYYTNPEKKETAKIIMVGDLMCRPSQIESSLRNGEYNFDEEFACVKDIISDSDLAIGNMETMVSHSIVYSDDAHYIDDRVHLNAPDSYLNSVRKAGFDVVINSQNHSYDTGTRGVLETLNALNQQQLIHTGIFSSAEDKRYISLQVNGINIAIVSYFDQARQPMKRVNYTERGLKVLYSNFIESQIKKDIEDARKEGAEFVIAYCHWGKEYINEATEKQMGLAQMVANAGADYLFGSHSHCLQPYTTIKTNDGRIVPVLYSAGNFLSDMSIRMPIVRDTLIAELVLYRDEAGKVQILSEGYHPCLIRSDEAHVRGRMITIPIEKLLENCRNSEKVQLEEDANRINDVVGRLPRFKSLLSKPKKGEPLCDGTKYGKYTIKNPNMIKISETQDEVSNKFYKDSDSKVFESKNNLETKEAVIMCTGQIGYDAELGNRARFGNYYNFKENFQLVKKCFEKSDLTIGNFTGMVDEEYLSSEMMISKYSKDKEYSNARIEYIDALKYAGFDCLAMANPNNLDTGVNGIWRTVQNVEKYGMNVLGIGEDKNKIFNVNDIKVGVLSYTIRCKNVDTMITDEGADELLNIYEQYRAKKDIEELKNNGAEFVLTYVTASNTAEDDRIQIAEELAENGADYVICTTPKFVSKYVKYTTKTGKVVPIASSLGTFMSGTFAKDSLVSAILRITLYKSEDGSIDVVDNYIPLKQFESIDGYNYAIVPGNKAFYPNFTSKKFEKVNSELKEKFGNQIKLAEDKIVKINEYTQAHLTFEEVFQLLDIKPKKEIKDKLDLNAKVTSVAARRAELKEGCVAVVIQHVGYKKPEFQIEADDVIKSKAALAISTKEIKGVPTIVVKKTELRPIVKKLYEGIMSKYNPITVAITGTAGKTTTKEFASCVFDTHYKTLHVVGNYNQFYTCGTVLQKLDKTYEAYVQEVHGGTKNSAKNISNLIKPDIAIITNIGDGHLLDMGTIENVIEGKLDIASGLKETGVLIVNNDNEYMHNLEIPGKRIIHYSTHDDQCEYYAKDIQNFGNKVKFKVVCEKGEFDLMLNMQGIHNVGNAIAVFAAATEANIPPYKIRAGLTHYVPDADKQNLMQYNGYNMIIDTYSATPISVESAMQTLNDYPVENGARRIAVLGDIPALGDASEEKHKEVGEKICKYNFDLMLCVGTDSKHFAIAAQKAGKEAYSYEDREEFNRKLAESIHPGDFILFKSGTRSHLKEETIYPLFGLIDKI